MIHYFAGMKRALQRICRCKRWRCTGSGCGYRTFILMWIWIKTLFLFIYTLFLKTIEKTLSVQMFESNYSFNKFLVWAITPRSRPWGLTLDRIRIGIIYIGIPGCVAHDWNRCFHLVPVNSTNINIRRYNISRFYSQSPSRIAPLI